MKAKRTEKFAQNVRAEMRFDAQQESGSTTLIAVLIMALVGAFVAVAVARVTAEARMMSNDSGETRAFYAAQASLETMTRNFNKVFDVKLTPATSDLTNVQNGTPIGFSNYTFQQTITPNDASQIVSQTVPISGGPFSGLTALQDKWVVTTTAIENGTNRQVQLTREFNNNRVPIFQFGVFKDWDLEFHAGPNFDFGGRVHSNGNIFLMEGNGSTLTFKSKVTAAGQVVTDVARNGKSAAAGNWTGTVRIDSTGAGNYVTLTQSSAGQNTAGSVINGPDTNSSDPNMPDGSPNPQWSTSMARFNGNLLNSQPRLTLPLKLGSASDNREIIKRPRADANDYEVAVLGRRADDAILAQSRYASGPRNGAIRITLADSQNELPGCRGMANCGVQLDGTYSNNGTSGAVGYKPPAMRDGYQATPFNGYRLYRGASYDPGVRGLPSNRQTWIKVEIVTINSGTGLPQAQEVTSSFLSLGMTEPAPAALVGASNSYITNGTDTRSIIKMQRFIIPGPTLRSAGATYISGSPVYTYSPVQFVSPATGGSFVSYLSSGSSQTVNSITFNANYVMDPKEATAAGISLGSGVTLVPFPIEMFDAREGVYNADDSTTINSYVSNGTLPVNGVMSIIDIDVANLKRLVDGNFDSALPNSVPSNEVVLSSSLIPRISGTILYISDRRGDRDFDGEYDMEDIFAKYDGNIYPGEDINGSDPSHNITGDGFLETSGALDCSSAPTAPCVHTTNDLPYVWEGSRYTLGGGWNNADGSVFSQYLTPATVNATTNNFATVNSDLAALFDHRYYRRGVRLINGAQPPGYTNVNGQTKGFTFASENGVYIKGNFNATGIQTTGSPTTATNYLPSYDLNGDTRQVPCSVVGDSLAILSNNWNDGQSFNSAFNNNNRVATETFIRTAVIAGSTLSFQLFDSSGNQLSTPSQGSGDAGLYGGVHNFLRFLENWSPSSGQVPLHYCGSLICLYTSRNNNGAHKTGGATYNAPRRDWIFDASFLDPTRLPPGTPFFQYLQITGFRRSNY
jgi:hypothetical protein